jgi:hypothetical protein
VPVAVLPVVHADALQKTTGLATVKREHQRENAMAAHHSVVIGGVLDPFPRMTVRLGERFPSLGQPMNNLRQSLRGDVIISPAHLLSRRHHVTNCPVTARIFGPIPHHAAFASIGYPQETVSCLQRFQGKEQSYRSRLIRQRWWIALEFVFHAHSFAKRPP